MLKIIKGSIERDTFSLKDINLEIHANSLTLITGRNSAGKSSLLYTITQAIALKEGSIISDDIKMAFIGQNLPMSLYTQVWDVPNLMRFIDDDFDRKIFQRIIDDFNIPRGKHLIELSSGQQKLLMLALSIARNVNLLLLDEINLNIDSYNEKQILDLLSDFISQDGKAVVLATNKLELFEDMADQLIYIHKNQIEYQGSIQDLLTKYSIYTGDAVFNSKQIVKVKKEKYQTTFLLENSQQGNPATVLDILMLLEKGDDYDSIH